MFRILFVLLTPLMLFASMYHGFMKIDPGAWAKYEIKSPDGKKSVMLLKYLGSITYKGKKVNIVESEITTAGTKIVSQYWSAIDNDSAIKKLITMTPQGIMCMEEQFFGAGQTPQYHLKTPKKYSPKKPNIRFSTYTLPNGKKIPVAIFNDNGSEVWVSSQVPFGIVLVKESKKVQMRLLDFGLSGAKAAIPIDQAKSCAPLALPPIFG